MLQSVNVNGVRAPLQGARAPSVEPPAELAPPQNRAEAAREASRQTVPFRRCANFLALAECAGLLVATPLALAVYLGLGLGPAEPPLIYVLSALLLSFTLHLFFRQMELYSIEALTQPTLELGKLWGGLVLSILVIHGALFLLNVDDVHSRGWTLCWLLGSAIAIVLVRWIGKRHIRSLVARGLLRHRVALVGTGDYVAALEEQLASSSPFCEVTGRFVIPDSDADTEQLPSDALARLQETMERRGYDVIVIGVPASHAALIKRAIKSLVGFSSELLLCTDIKTFGVMINESRSLGRLRADIINVVPKSERNRFLKRVLDCVIAASGIVVLSPVLALIALAIKLDSPGPVFFRQRRYGQNNLVFRIFKFRTMHVAEDGQHVTQATRGDNRVTRVGRLLRASSLDEVPQLFNVLRGDMSIVGPRPHALIHDKLFEEHLDLFSRRRRVQPGMTGWAQVNGYRGETRTTEDVRARLDHDLYYIENWSIWLDVEIIFRTVLVVLRGAY